MSAFQLPSVARQLYKRLTATFDSIYQLYAHCRRQSGAGFLGNVPVGIRCCKSEHGRIGSSVHRQYYCEQPDFIHILPILSASTFLIPITLFTPGQNHEEQLVYKQPQAALLPVTQLTLFKTIPILVRLLAISLQLQHPISFNCLWRSRPDGSAAQQVIDYEVTLYFSGRGDD